MVEGGDWPNSSRSIDAVHANRVMYSAKHFNRVFQEETQVVILGSLDGAENIILDFNEKNILTPGSRSSQKSDPIYLDEPTKKLILKFNGSLENQNKLKYYANFVSFVHSRYKEILIGGYHSSSTCIINSTNKTLNRNIIPKTVLSCDSLGQFSATSNFFNDQRFNSDGRVYIDFSDTVIVSKAIERIVHRAVVNNWEFVFLDNARFFGANWRESALCEREFQLCINACRKSDCYNECLSKMNCNDTRKDGVKLFATSEWKIQFEEYSEYYRNLINELNANGVKCIINMAVRPHILKNAIEFNQYNTWRKILKNNGVAFEMAFDGRSSPKNLRNEVSSYREFLENNTAIFIYPDYKNADEARWFAGLACILKSQSDPIFVMRSPYQAVAPWIHLPKELGEPQSKFQFITDCLQCMNQRGGFQGNSIMTREFEKKCLAVVHLNISEGKQPEELWKFISQELDLAASNVDNPKVVQSFSEFIENCNSVEFDYLQLIIHDSIKPWEILISANTND